MRAGRAGGHCRWLHGDADPPYEQGADALRFIPLGAVVRTDGGRPTSRGLPPAVVWGTGDVRKRGLFPQKGILKGLDRLSSKCNSLEEDLERRAPAKPLAGPVVDQIQNALKFRL